MKISWMPALLSGQYEATPYGIFDVHMRIPLPLQELAHPSDGAIAIVVVLKRRELYICVHFRHIKARKGLTHRQLPYTMKSTV